MLSYQHSYHAGNPADLHKHIVLAELLALLRKKDRGLTYVETHAGRALYDISAEEARKTGEADQGIGRLSLSGDSAFEHAIRDTRTTHGSSAYPGSPLFALHGARSNDRVVLMELHPGEAAALKGTLKHSLAEVHRRDGYEGVTGLAPFEPRKGLVLIDPAYEVKSEYDQVGKSVTTLMKKWPQASVLVWYPILPANRQDGMVSALSEFPHLRDEVNFDAKKDHGMKASGLILINPPYGAQSAFDAAHRIAESVIRPRASS